MKKHRKKSIDKISEIPNFEIIKNQIGCGYCHKEETCLERDAKVNKAKLGCKFFSHWAEQSINQQTADK